MNRRAAGFILGLALALILGGALWWFLSTRSTGRDGRTGQAAGDGPVAAVPFNLYFPADGGRLRAETRELKVTERPKDRVRKLVQALLAGPKAQGLVRLFPEGVELGSVQLGQDGTAYVELRWADHVEPPPSGSTEEMQRVYGLVNTVCLNVSQAQRVVLLWNGVQPVTFGGHLDLSQPLTPNQALLAP